MSETNGFITREQALKPLTRRFTTAEINGWGKFRLRSLSELERSRFEASCRDKKGQVAPTKLLDMKCRMIVLAAVDGEGNQIFTNSDVDQLRQQDSKFTNALVDEIQKHWGVTDDDLEDLEKNCEPTAGVASH